MAREESVARQQLARLGKRAHDLAAAAERAPRVTPPAAAREPREASEGPPWPEPVAAPIRAPSILEHWNAAGAQLPEVLPSAPCCRAVGKTAWSRRLWPRRQEEAASSQQQGAAPSTREGKPNRSLRAPGAWALLQSDAWEEEVLLQAAAVEALVWLPSSGGARHPIRAASEVLIPFSSSCSGCSLRPHHHLQSSMLLAVLLHRRHQILETLARQSHDQNHHP